MAALWGGIAVAWVGAVVLAYLLFRERFVAVLVVTTAAALIGGTIATVRLKAGTSDRLITVEDLRRR